MWPKLQYSFSPQFSSFCESGSHLGLDPVGTIGMFKA